MNIQVDPTSSNLTSAMLNSKIRPHAVVGYGVFLPSPLNYVTRSPGYDELTLRFLGSVQTDATTHIVSSCWFDRCWMVLAVVHKRMPQLPTMLGCAVYYGKVYDPQDFVNLQNSAAILFSRRSYPMPVRGPKNVERAVQTDQLC